MGIRETDRQKDRKNGDAQLESTHEYLKHYTFTPLKIAGNEIPGMKYSLSNKEPLGTLETK